MEYHSGGSLPLLGRPRYCPGANANGGYLCETGHCCGETGCCTYYYELWWFWLLWTVLILFSCCCAYRHRRAKLRVQQQQRQREISLLAYQGASSYPSSMLDLSFLASLKLPSYEEVAAQPSTPPPPYSSVFTTPRYPQPPRTANPHLLTQDGPLLHHHPLSDGPSSLSSDNSSSCSCDSCCPSSPCSSSLSAPITYETDTSHASTPSEVAPLARDSTLETIAAAVSCLEAGETQAVVERTTASVDAEPPERNDLLGAAATAPEPIAKAVVSRDGSPHSPPSSSSEMVLAVGTMSPVTQQHNLTATSPIDNASSPLAPSNPSLLDTTVPSTLMVQSCGPNEDPIATPVPNSGTSQISLITSTSTNQTLESLNATRTSDKASVTSSPGLNSGPGTLSAPSNPNLSPDSTHLQHGWASDPVPSNHTVPSDAVSSNLIPCPVPAPSDITLALELASSHFTPISVPQPLVLLQVPESTDLVIATDRGLCSPTSSTRPNQELAQSPPVSSSIPSSHSDTLAGLGSGLETPKVPSPASSQSSQPDHANPNIQLGFDGCGPCQEFRPISSPLCSPDSSVSTFPPPASSSPPFLCPAITVNPDSLSSPDAPSLSPPLLSPPSPSSTSLLAPALLLDPFSALQQSDRGGTSASSGHASSLSPSPRNTQSPPKQTLFSPCVDIFEPGPVNWGEDEEEEQNEENNNDDDEDDVGADESQYRHRRLTGDSGIEVCRCQVEEEDEEEEEEEEEEGRKRGGKAGEEREKAGSGVTDLHDSVDCPARSQTTSEEGLTLCNPHSTTTSLACEDSGDVVITMETA